MMMDMPILMGVHHAFVVDVDCTSGMIFNSQAMRDRLAAGQRKGQCRRKHAKQVGQGDQPPCPSPMRSGQPYQHQCFNASDLSLPVLQIIEAKPPPAKPVTHSSSAQRIGTLSTRDLRIDEGLSSRQRNKACGALAPAGLI